MKKAQTALEYLIMVVAILAVSAVVILFITGAFGVQKSQAGWAECKRAATQCQLSRMITPDEPCAECEDACMDTDGFDLMSDVQGCGSACSFCKAGDARKIYARNETERCFNGIDNPYYGQCAQTQPLYCDFDGQIINNCAECGCPDGKYCDSASQQCRDYVTCTTAAECTDTDPTDCKVPDCQSSVCILVNANDGTACPIGFCENGLCTSTVCISNADCGDANTCTTDVCNFPGTSSAYCSHTAIITCGGSDGCCPSGCTNANDADCAATPDTTPPVISSILATPSTTSASISWATDELTNHTVKYRISTLWPDSPTYIYSSTRTYNHVQAISGLAESTAYKYTIKACDASNNCVESAVQSFTTTATIPTNPVTANAGADKIFSKYWLSDYLGGYVCLADNGKSPVDYLSAHNYNNLYTGGTCSGSEITGSDPTYHITRRIVKLLNITKIKTDFAYKHGTYGTGCQPTIYSYYGTSSTPSAVMSPAYCSSSFSGTTSTTTWGQAATPECTTGALVNSSTNMIYNRVYISPSGSACYAQEISEWNVTYQVDSVPRTAVFSGVATPSLGATKITEYAWDFSNDGVYDWNTSNLGANKWVYYNILHGNCTAGAIRAGDLYDSLFSTDFTEGGETNLLMSPYCDHQEGNAAYLYQLKNPPHYATRQITIPIGVYANVSVELEVYSNEGTSLMLEASPNGGSSWQTCGTLNVLSPGNQSGLFNLSQLGCLPGTGYTGGNLQLRVSPTGGGYEMFLRRFDVKWYDISQPNGIVQSLGSAPRYTYATKPAGGSYLVKMFAKDDLGNTGTDLANVVIEP